MHVEMCRRSLSNEIVEQAHWHYCEGCNRGKPFIVHSAPPPEKEIKEDTLWDLHFSDLDTKPTEINESLTLKGFKSGP